MGFLMPGQSEDGLLRPGLGVKETIETDHVLRWDGDRLYVEQDVYHNGQLVHRKYKRGVTPAVAKAIARLVETASSDEATTGPAGQMRDGQGRTG